MKLKKPLNSAIEIKYLDANFPFINNFPLLSHLSHNNGENLDIAFIYQTKSGKITDQKKSISDYDFLKIQRRKNTIKQKNV